MLATREMLNGTRQLRAERAVTWLVSVLIAVGGSLFYGATLGRGVDLSVPAVALWFTASAGLGWLLFLPVLTHATGKPRETIDACLRTMVCGEIVLVTAAWPTWYWSWQPSRLVGFWCSTLSL